MALRHTLLGLLIFKPRTGYDLYKRAEQATFLLESATLRRIYPTLKRLAEEGLVEYEVEPQEGKPDRKVYSVTDEGEAAFMAWLREPPVPDALNLDHLLAKFFFYGLLDRETVLAHLRATLRQRQNVLAEITGITFAPPAGPCRPIVDSDRVMNAWGMMLDYGRAETKTQVRWLKETIQQMEQQTNT